uniref:Uncharacterized protein n=1 Tax=Schistocephalus solidus TaxID=70667 RepID=A0A0X3PNI9_SCHSO
MHSNFSPYHSLSITFNFYAYLVTFVESPADKNLPLHILIVSAYPSSKYMLDFLSFNSLSYFAPIRVCFFTNLPESVDKWMFLILKMLPSPSTFRFNLLWQFCFLKSPVQIS